MENQHEILFFARPSLRRAFFFAFLYAGAVLYGRILTEFDRSLNQFWLYAMGVLLVIMAFVLLKRACTSYLIASDEVLVKSGILAREYITVPQARITNAYARQSILDRLLFITNLQIDCAGGDTKEVTFRRITVGEARQAGRILRSLRGKPAASEHTAQAAAVG